ncbi:hypothetical protein [Legionella septentrionalis]|uniref:Uncharacterized protein n=1 Tax=Legionella septentrionalis TaxID=2498109 RepID=A0A433JKR2_9GAMM|nr:hypothetical protein [Legionella septentrionalis]RUQ89218.1 hypothetical protein EKM59_03830 [Legionella septentrionalis]
MSHISVNVIGIMIDADEKNFRLCEIEKRFKNTKLNHASGDLDVNSSDGFSMVQGLDNIIKFLSSIEPANPSVTTTKLILIYDPLCPNREELLKKMLSEIKKYRAFASWTLMTIGEEQSPLKAAEEADEIRKISVAGYPESWLQGLLKKEAHAMEFSLKLEEKKADFLMQLDIIRAKAADLRKNNYLPAAEAAQRLHTNLTEISKIYFANPTEHGYVKFKENAEQEIDKAHQELDKHRQVWKPILANIALAILGFGVLYFVAVLINRNFFFNKTDSSKKLDGLSAVLDTNTYQIG